VEQVEQQEPVEHARPTEEFEPRVVAFLCNWCTYTGADLAGTSRLQYPPNVRIVRLMCTGAVDTIYVLKALLEGADGVLIGGCHPGDCHYQSGNYKARRRVGCDGSARRRASSSPTRLRTWSGNSRRRAPTRSRGCGPFEEYRMADRATHGAPE